MTRPISLEAWLSSRTPAPPPALAARVREIAEAGGTRASPTADALLEAARRATRALLRDGCDTRDCALDLLAVDALVTYAFEAAADDPQALEGRAEGTLGRIASLAEPFET